MAHLCSRSPAAQPKLRNYLPSTSIYIPVDCVAVHPGTFVVDFNDEFRLPDAQVDVIVSSGFLEHIVDLEGFVRQLADAKEGCLVGLQLLLFARSGALPEAAITR